MRHLNLWAPWRMEYIREMDRPGGSACFLCEAWAGNDDDEEHLVVWRNEQGLILLNCYPYTNGHLLVALGAHRAALADYTADERAALMELTAVGERLLTAALNPQGINVGINLGRCAGAGLPGHLHVHVVPRWNGDTNFMQVVGQVRVIPQALEEILAELKAVVQKVI